MRVITILVAVVVWCGVATAGPPPETPQQRAKVHFEKASRNYTIGEFKAALDEFKAAYLEVPHPALLYNIAQCHRMLGEWENAARQYRFFINDMPGAANRAEAEEHLAEALQHVKAPNAPTPATATTKVTPPPVTPVAPTEPTAPSVTTPTEPTVASAVTTTPVVTPTPSGPRRWWIGVVVAGAVVVAGGAVGLGVGLGTPPSDAPTNLGNSGSFDVKLP